MANVAELTQLNILAGADIETRTMTALANAAIIPAFTPMKLNAAYKLVPCTSIADTVVGLTVPGLGSSYGALVGLEISASDRLIEVFTEISIYTTAIDFTAVTDADSDLKKQAMFATTNINPVLNAAGF